MIKWTVHTVIAFELVIGGATVASAAEDGPDRRYQTIWHIQADQRQVGMRTITVGDPVIEQRLLPFGLAVADEDILSESGEVLVAKGSQLFQLRVATGSTFCVAEVPRPSAFRSLMLGGGNLQLCLVDRDTDGRFDGQFNGGNPMRGVPYIAGRQPRNPKSAAGKYSLLAPEQFALRYTVRIMLDSMRTPKKGKPMVSYRVDFGDELTRQELTNTISATLGSTTILGAQWVASENGPRGLKLEVSSAMPDQPFEVERAIRYR